MIDVFLKSIGEELLRFAGVILTGVMAGISLVVFVIILVTAIDRFGF
jgi:hypothetical protein